MSKKKDGNRSGQNGHAKDTDLARDTQPPGEQMTTNQGLRLTDDQNSLKAGVRGPTLLEDFHFREKITHFDHERIPERVVHARGTGAHGYFQVYEPLTELTKAGLFQNPSLKTPVWGVAGLIGRCSTGDDKEKYPEFLKAELS